MEAEISNDRISGEVLEDQDYLEKINKLEGYMDEVKFFLQVPISEIMKPYLFLHLPYGLLNGLSVE